MNVHMLNSLSMKNVGIVGGKAASLGELLQAKQRVPAGFVIGADAQTMSPALQKGILRVFDEMGLARVAVRSSGVEEDGHDRSWAGQFATLLNIDRSGLLAAVQACWASASSIRAQAYGKAARLAVLVQHMVQGDVSGVAFSADPVTGNKGHIVVEAVHGLCEPLVSGTATPDHFVLEKSGSTIIESEIAEKPTMLAFRDGQTKKIAVPLHLQNKPALGLKQLQAIAALARSVEAHYGFAVDIEWTYEGNTLYVLQARPITTL
jgi:phosphoenolpyruvate synthase/pyruvate phosphate dikinase